MRSTHGNAVNRRTEENPKIADRSVIERCTIIVTPRDLFSTTEECLEQIFKNTPEPFDLLVVMGGAPEALRATLEARYKDKVHLIFRPDFLNGSQLRNIGLREAKTRLAVCLDTNVFVRAGWLAPLISSPNRDRCKRGGSVVRGSVFNTISHCRE